MSGYFKVKGLCTILVQTRLSYKLSEEWLHDQKFEISIFKTWFDPPYLVDGDWTTKRLLCDKRVEDFFKRPNSVTDFKNYIINDKLGNYDNVPIIKDVRNCTFESE